VDRFLIRPAGELNGTITVQGAKNSALKLMAATLLAEGDYVLRRVPAIDDVAIMAELLTSMGVTVRRQGDGALAVHRGATCTPEAPY